MVWVLENLLPQFWVVRQLSVESEAEPLRLLNVMPLERLGIAAVILATGRVADMSNRGRPSIFGHQGLEVLTLIKLKDLGHRPDFLVRVNSLIAIRTVGRHASRELPAVLDIQE